MEEKTAGFAEWADEVLGKLQAHYTPHFTFERGAQFAGERLAMTAQMHDRQPMAILGFKMDRLGPRASEYIFVFKEDAFDLACLARVEALLKEARREYVRPDPDQAYTFLSAIVIAGRVEAQSEAVFKKRRCDIKNMGGMGGWSATRIVAIIPESRVIGNRDSSELRNLIRRVLNGPPEK